MNGQRDFLVINGDFSQQEINILSKFSQKSGEKLLDWMIRIADTGAGGIIIDSVDAPRFITISTNPFVQTTIRDHQHVEGAMTTLLALAARGCTAQYATDTSWPVETQPWYTIGMACTV